MRLGRTQRRIGMARGCQSGCPRRVIAIFEPWNVAMLQLLTTYPFIMDVINVLFFIVSYYSVNINIH